MSPAPIANSTPEPHPEQPTSVCELRVDAPGRPSGEPSRRALIAGAATAAGLGLAGCAQAPTLAGSTHATSSTSGNSTSGINTSGGGTGASSTQPTTATPSASAPTQDHRAQAESLALEARVGQLIMVGHTTSELTSDTAELLQRHHVGFLLLLGDALNSRQDVAVLTSALSGLEMEVSIMVGVDQEGGRIQRLAGPGFTRIPTAVHQGTLAPPALQKQWAAWAGELARAGVRFNLAPVADVVPPTLVTTNAPIGQLSRHYGTDRASVGACAAAAVGGMTTAGVASCAKHFPGLGKVTTNTDFGESVDEVTAAGDADLSAFEQCMAAKVSAIMISSAVYRKIDPGQQAVFSSQVITGMLRERLGWSGVVISDDLGAAASVKHIAPGERATRFLRAGGDVIINADPALTSVMTAAILAEAKKDAAFERELTDKAARVLGLKATVA